MTDHTPRARRFALLALSALLVAPLVYAGLADVDLAGAGRASPPTMGALEAGTVTATNIPAIPTGLLVSRLN